MKEEIVLNEGMERVLWLYVCLFIINMKSKGEK